MGDGSILCFLDDDTGPITSDGLTLSVPDEWEDQTKDVTVDGLTRNHSHHLLGNPHVAAG